MAHPRRRRRRRDRRARRPVGRDAEGDGRARRPAPSRHRAGASSTTAREHLAKFKCPTSRRLGRRAAAQPERQDPQEGPPRARTGRAASATSTSAVASIPAAGRTGGLLGGSDHSHRRRRRLPCRRRSPATCARRYGERYRVVRATSGAEALDVLEELARRDQPVALIVVRSPHAGDDRHRAAAAARSRSSPAPSSCCSRRTPTPTSAIKAINEIGLDHYLMKPWAPPDERPLPGPRRSARRLGDARTAIASTACASSATGGRSAATRPACSWPATTCRTSGWSWSATPEARTPARPVRRRRRRRCRWCCCPTARSLHGADHA